MRRPSPLLLLPTALVFSLLPTASPTLSATVAEGSVGGVITGAGGEPLADVCIQVERGMSGGMVATTATLADGSWAVGGLTAGDYLVGVNTCVNGVAGSAAQWWPGVGDSAEASLVGLDEDEARSDIDLSLPAAGAVSGVVVDEASGDPLEGVCVMASDLERATYGDATTSADGSYRLASLAPGAYVLTFDDCTAPRTHLGEAYPDVPANADPDTALSRTQQITVTAGQEVPDISAKLGTSGVAVGEVVALHTGRPVRGVCVAAYRVNAETSTSVAVTGASDTPDVRGDAAQSPGQYQLTYLPGGQYEVVVADPACHDDGYVSAWIGGSARGSADRFTVEDGSVTTLASATVSASPSLTMACGFPSQDETSPFTDVRGDSVHSAAIACAAARGVASGKTADTFDPAGTVRRDQMASFTARLLRAAGVALPTAPADAFHDDNGNTHELAVNQLAELGVVGGTGGGRFSPGGLVRRNAMATFLVKAYEEVAGYPLLASEDRFADDTGDPHESSINKSATAAFAAGVGAGAYAPVQEVRREQMASFLVRALDRLIRDVAPHLAASRQPTAASRSSLAGADIVLQNHAGTFIRWSGIIWKVLIHVRRPTVSYHIWSWHCRAPKHFTIAPVGEYMSTFWCLKAAGGVQY